MFPEELTQVISKYKDDNKIHIQNIYDNLCGIMNSLKIIKSNIVSELSNILTSDDIVDTTEILEDINVLKEHISYINSFMSNRTIEDSVITEEFSEEIIPIFTKKVYPYLISDDLCPFDNVKLISHYIYYQKIVDNKIREYSMMGYRCPLCNKLFVIDYETEDFEFDDTNIIVNRSKYDLTPQISIYSIIILSNTLKCSANHDVKDIIAKLPVLNEQGQISYISVNASYCPTCNRYTILKEDFNAIAGIITCKIIDETVSCSNSSNFDTEIDNRYSILAQYGYNVQTKKDLSEQQRHIILSSIIEAQIMSRREVIDHINTLIERGSKIPSWKTATQKWKDDKQFVAEYDSDTLPEIIFDNIVLKYKK